MGGPRMQSFGNRINWGKQIQNRSFERRKSDRRTLTFRKRNQTHLNILNDTLRDKPRDNPKDTRRGDLMTKDILTGLKLEVITYLHNGGENIYQYTLGVDDPSPKHVQPVACRQLYEYSMNGDHKELEKLLRSGVDPNDCNFKYLSRGYYIDVTVSRNAFIECMFNDKFESLRLLLKYGFDLNRPIKGTPPLIAFCENNIYRNTLGRWFYSEEEIRAKRNRFINIFNMIIEGGADINGQDDEGNTCLHYLIFCADTFYFRYAESKGADRTMLNNGGNDPRDHLLSRTLSRRQMNSLYSTLHPLRKIMAMKIQLAGGDPDEFKYIAKPYKF